MDIALKTTFQNLPLNRRNKILNECRKEFAEHGYEKASTNRIVAALGIAKGSFFKYFGSKENLYLYLINEIYKESAEVQGNPDYYKKTDLFDRLDELLEYSMKYCRENPLKYRIILEGELNATSGMYTKILNIKKEFSDGSLWAIFEDVNWDLYSMEKNEIVTVFIWFVKGVKADLNERITAGVSSAEYEKVLYERIKIYKKAIFNGIYREIQDEHIL